MNSPHPDTAIAMCREQEAKIERLKAVNAELLEACETTYQILKLPIHGPGFEETLAMLKQAIVSAKDNP